MTLRTCSGPLVHDLVDSMALARPDHTAVFVVRPEARRRAEQMRPAPSDGPRVASGPGSTQEKAIGSHGCSMDAEHGEAFSFRDIVQLADSAAHTLQSAWSKRKLECAPDCAERNVVILVDEGIGLVVSELAVMKAGAAFVPVDPGWPSQRIAFIFEDCAASAVIVSKAGAASCVRKLETAGIAIAEEGCEQGGSHVPLIVIEDAMHSTGEAGVLRVPAISHRGEGAASHVIYTSGSTGVPKGVICEHRSLVNFIRAKAVAHSVGASSRVLVAAASTWDPSLGDIFCALAHGATACIAGRATLVESLAAVLLASRATHLSTTPALWALLPPTLGPSSFPHLSVLALGGERMPEAVARRWGTREGGLRLLNTYGVTEATVYQTVHDVRCDERGVAEVLAGSALEGVLVAVEGDAAMCGASDGEILVGGVQVARGYLNRDELTAAKFFTDSDGTRWFRTGDLGRWVAMRGDGAGADGNQCGETAHQCALAGTRGKMGLQVLGRVDLQVKLRGFRVELEEVEAVIKQCRLVRNAAVVLHRSGGGTEGHQREEKEEEGASIAAGAADRAAGTEVAARLVAFVELYGDEAAGGGSDDSHPEDASKPRGAEAAAEEEAGRRRLERGGEIALRLHCQRRMPAFQVPAQIVGIGRLPLTDSGKLDRQSLPRPPPIRARGRHGVGVVSGRGGGEGVVSAKTAALEAVVGRVWGEVLGVGNIGRWDHFWELGGSSVLAVRMLGRLEEAVGSALVAATRGRWASTAEDRMRVRLCGLHRKPRLKDFVRFLEWAAVAAPNAVESQAREAPRAAEVGGRAAVSDVRVGDGGGREGKQEEGGGDGKEGAGQKAGGEEEGGREEGEEVLGRLDTEQPMAEDEGDVQRAGVSLAAEGGDAGVLRCLLAMGASPEGWAVHDHVRSPLMLAASGGHLAAAAALVEAGASVRPVDALHANALHLAAAGGHVEVMELLLSPRVGAPRDARTLNKWSAVHYAAFHGRVAALEALLRHGAPLSLKDRWSRTPLAWAVFNGHVEAAARLIEAGGVLAEGGEHGRNQPQLARQRRLGNRWSPAIVLAVQAEQRAARRRRAEAGAQGEEEEELAVGVLELLLRHRRLLAVRIDAADAAGRTALHQACLGPAQDGGKGGAADEGEEKGHADGTGAGIEVSPGVSAPEEEEERPGSDQGDAGRDLSASRVRGAGDACAAVLVRRLLRAGADANARDLSGQTPLHCAAEGGCVPALELLLGAGAELRRRDDQGRSARDVATCAVCRDILREAERALPEDQREQAVASGALQSGGGGSTGRGAGGGGGAAARSGKVGWVEEQNQLMGAAFFTRIEGREPR